MDENKTVKVMAEVKKSVIDYLEDELRINTAILKTYEDKESIINSDTEIKMMREIEAIKLRDRTHELTRHIAVIRRMYNG